MGVVSGGEPVPTPLQGGTVAVVGKNFVAVAATGLELVTDDEPNDERDDDGCDDGDDNNLHSGAPCGRLRAGTDLLFCNKDKEQ